MTIETILNNRHETYGTFSELAAVAVGLRNELLAGLFHAGRRLPPDHEEALVHICTKMARIVNGQNPSHVDNWRDIAGYATLVADRLEGKSR